MSNVIPLKNGSISFDKAALARLLNSPKLKGTPIEQADGETVIVHTCRKLSRREEILAMEAGLLVGRVDYSPKRPKINIHWIRRKKYESRFIFRCLRNQLKIGAPTCPKREARRREERRRKAGIHLQPVIPGTPF